MNTHVSGDHVPAAGGVRTLWTFIWLFPSMSSLMGVQVVTAAKHLATDTALIRLEPRVQTHMTGQHIATGESTVTHLAIVHFVVVPRAHRLRGEMLGHVFGQVIIRGKHLTTDRTQVRYIRVGKSASFSWILNYRYYSGDCTDVGYQRRRKRVGMVTRAMDCWDRTLGGRQGVA